MGLEFTGPRAGRRGFAPAAGSRQIRKLVFPLILVALPFVFFWEAAASRVLLGDGDGFVQFLPFWQFAAEQWAQGSPPFWSHHIFSGFPLLAEPQAGVFHPLKALFLLFHPMLALNITVMLYHGIAGVFTYLLCREEGLAAEASLLAGIAYQFCGFLLGHQPINALFITAATIPVLFYALRKLASGPEISRIAGGGAAVLALTLGGHFQFTFYALFFGLFYGLYLAAFVVKQRQRLRFLFALASVYAIGTLWSAVQILPTAELTGLSVRSALTYDDFVGPSMHLATLVTSLISTRIYILFPNDGSEAMLDVGIVVLVLAVFGALLERRRSAFWGALALFSAALYLGNRTPLYSLMYYVPGYNLFRLASRNGVMLDLALCVLAAYGLHALLRKSPRLGTGLGHAAAASIPLVYYFLIDRPEKKLHSGLWRASRQREDELLSWSWADVWGQFGPHWHWMLLLVLGTAALAAALHFSQGRRVPAFLAIALAASHFWTYRQWTFRADFQEASSALQERVRLPVESTLYRTALAVEGSWIDFRRAQPADWKRKYVALGGPDVNMLKGVHSVNGYTPLVIRDYSRLIGGIHMSGYLEDPAFFQSPALNLLNVRYVVAPAEPAPAIARERLSHLEPVSMEEFGSIYRNPHANGFFWSVETVESMDEERMWRYLRDPDRDFRATALTSSATGPSKGSVRWYSPASWVGAGKPIANGWTVEVHSESPTFLATSLIRYPGWRARIPGKELDIVSINGIFMGVEVPEGSHQVVFRFEPSSFRIGLFLGLAGFGLLGFLRWRGLFVISGK